MQSHQLSLSDHQLRELRAALLDWFAHHAREMPWRGCGNSYGIWVSEVMLQQTQVSRVESYWRRFMDRFPSLQALAQASEDEVLALWSGLGYYRRARALQAAARQIMADHAGRLPDTSSGLASLPGMGPYTSAAVASIAFGEPVPVLDANVKRVLARLTREQEPVSRAATRDRLLACARRLIDDGRPGDFNQAMMEVGSLVCHVTQPACGPCPLQPWCQACAHEDAECYPVPESKARPVRLREMLGVIIRRGKVLLTQMPHERGWWPGLWRLPSVAGADAGRLQAHVRESFGLRVVWTDEREQVRYGITNHAVSATVCRSASVAGRLVSGTGRWYAAPQALQLGLPAAHRRILEHLPDR